MDKADIVLKFASSADDELFLRKVWDKLEKARIKNIPACTRFLTAAQQALAKQFADFSGARFVFLRGWEGAERAVMVFLPEWMEDAPEGEDSPAAVIKGEFAGDYASIGHRDVLGALMGLGIERDTIGDINVSDGKIFFTALREIVPYILQNFASAGRVHMSLTEISPEQAEIKEMPSKLISATVSALRLDSIVSAGFHLSREKSAQLIKSGSVTLDHLQCMKPDKTAEENSVITVRGSGKIVLSEVRGETKKGRIAITIKKFI